MFIESLTIANNEKIIRNIKFRNGINLIIDETEIALEHKEKSGNNVGKTTVLSLIDFCLGGDENYIYCDYENKKDINKLVKSFLIDKNIVITLILTSELDNPDAKKIVIKRNFHKYKKNIRTINGIQIPAKDFESKLSEYIFPNKSEEKPTFNQLIAHNIRYHDHRINNTLKYLSPYAKDEEYEALYLFMLGCNFSESDTKQKILEQLSTEKTYKNRLEKDCSRATYETLLRSTNEEISKLNKQKKLLNTNPNLLNEYAKLDKIRYEISIMSARLSQQKIKREIIIESQNALLNKEADIDKNQVQLFYSQVKQNLDGINKTFFELLNFHNQMLVQKAKFIGQDLPQLNNEISIISHQLKELVTDEARLAEKVVISDAFSGIEDIIVMLTKHSQDKGKFEECIEQIIKSESVISNLEGQLKELDNMLFSEEFYEKIKLQVEKFNEYFSQVSMEMYNEKYVLQVEKTINTRNKHKQIYRFTIVNTTNYSSGAKQGEISCFDIAYTLFANAENMPCLQFLLTDKKELVHDNQLTSIAELVNKHNIQFISSILKDKLPQKLRDGDYAILSLSQHDKLFRIENYNEIPSNRV